MHPCYFAFMKLYIPINHSRCLSNKISTFQTRHLRWFPSASAHSSDSPDTTGQMSSEGAGMPQYTMMSISDIPKFLFLMWPP